jgi:hypothetical protein
MGFWEQCGEHDFVPSAGFAWVVAVPRTRANGEPKNVTTMVAMERREFRWACMSTLASACTAGTARLVGGGRLLAGAVGCATWLALSPWIWRGTGVHVRTFER